MKNNIIFLVLVISLAGCLNGDKTIVITNEDRVKELERRADLNDQLNLVQNTLIELNAVNINAVNIRIDNLNADLRQLVADEAAARAAADQDLQNGLEDEEAARIAGDGALAASIAAETAARAAANSALLSALAASVAAQTVVNLVVQGQLALINSKFGPINTKLAQLKARMDNAESGIEDLQDDLGDLQVSLSDLNARLLAAEGNIDSLQDDVTALTARLDQEGVKVYKCDALSSKERIFRINGRFYAVMNYVTTRQVSVQTAGASQSFSTPKLCANSGDNLKLADSNGDCQGSGFGPVPGSGVTVTVPSYSSSNVTVVDSVSIALERLEDGAYSTTDGGTVCSFSISGGGVSSSNLIQVQ